MRFLAVLAILLLPGLAHAAEADVYCQTGTSATGVPTFAPASASQPCPITVGGTTAPVKGFGNLTGTGASALLSTLTTGPNSAAWPTTPGQVYVIATGGTGYVCPEGGTCSATNGIPIGGIVAGWGFNAPSTNMTVYGASSVTFTAQW